MSGGCGWRVEVIFSGSVPKREGERNEDQYQIDTESLRFVLSDGASVSYDPATWAELLCRKFLEDPVLDAAWIADAASSYTRTVDRESLPWMKQAAYDQGSFASLLGLSLSLETQKIEITAIGDSNVMIMSDGFVVKTFPIVDVEEFSRSPDLVCTVASENDYLTEDVISAAKKIFDLKSVVDEDNVAILMATDALSSWVMSADTDIRLDALFAITGQDQFDELVANARNEGDLKIDDTTMITIRISRDLSPEH